MGAVWFSVVGQNETPEDRFGREVQEETDFDRGSAEIIDDLSFMAGVERAAGLELYRDAPFDQQISMKVANDVTIEVDSHGSLAFDVQTSLAQRDHHCSLVHGFEKPVTELVMDMIERPDDRTGDIIVKHG